MNWGSEEGILAIILA